MPIWFEPAPVPDEAVREVCIALVLGWPYLRKVDDTCVSTVVMISGSHRVGCWWRSSSWGFRLDWSVHPISNVPPYLSEESTLVSRLTRILSISRAIRDMTELWLVEAGLSPAPRGAMDLSTLRDMPKMSAGKSTPAARVTPSPEVEEVHVEATPTPELHSREKEPTASGREVVPRVYRRSKSMKVLYNTTVRKDDERYYILHMADLYLSDSDSELRARLSNLKSLMQVWDDSRAARLSDAQRELKEQRVGRQMADDELLKAMKELKAQRTDLPKKAVKDYKASAGFGWGLQRIG
ncbi:hypothetical protein B296_00030377 [Ensete ventricosum]|uniref:Uncharacterized protein n=1 Tax=Ensete ventricosum TaxID=4639 RepID=A0A426ZB75_ENSVE|nr:hypothetical protein B296_00030377 [Ensete ventricosum]